MLPAGLAAQEPHILQDARLPQAGEVWIELFPALLDWHERFDVGGDRLLVRSRFEGSILSRFFPPITDQILAELNDGSTALGYEPLASEEVSVGGLDFGTVHAQVLRALASVRVGVLDRVGFLDRVAVELGLPIVSTRVEPLFAWDTAAATVARASVALPDAGSFLSDLGDARSGLQARVDAGELTAEEEAQALALLEDSGAFLDALQARVEEDRFLPLASTGAGGQLLTRLDALAQGFSAFEVAFPSLALRDSPGVADLQAFFTGEPLSGRLPGASDQGFEAGEVEAGLLVGLLDTSADREAGLRLRTSVGAKLRIPTRDADAPPFADRTDPFRVPIGDGQRDVEIAVYQDVWLGSRFRLGAAGRGGIQSPDRLLVRVHPPDRPFATPATEAAVHRDLGDYLQLRVSPQYLLNDVLALGAEYGFWRKGADEFRLLEEVPGLADAGPLAIGTRETRHRLGLGIFYRPGEGRRSRGRAPEAEAGADEAGTEEAAADEAPTREAGADEAGEVAERRDRSDRAEGRKPLPWRIGVVLQWSLAGSGGRTPASRLLMATLRIPFRPF